jgi:translation initiation factor 2 beta subunit (eIF-2beta)/eIF-5
MGLVSVMKRIMNEYERTRIKFVRHFVKCQTCGSSVPSNFCLKGKKLREAYLKAERIQLDHE